MTEKFGKYRIAIEPGVSQLKDAIEKSKTGVIHASIENLAEEMGMSTNSHSRIKH